MRSKFRLKRAIDFKRVRRNGKSFAHPFLVLVFLPNELQLSRVGVAAGKRLGGAVQRNRVKRVLRAAMAAVWPKVRPGYDIIVIARPDLLNQKTPAVQAALQHKLHQANLLIENGS